MKSFLCVWLALITLSTGIIARDRTIGTVLMILSVVLVWLAGS